MVGTIGYSLFCLYPSWDKIRSRDYDRLKAFGLLKGKYSTELERAKRAGREPSTVEKVDYALTKLNNTLDALSSVIASIHELQKQHQVRPDGPIGG
jgi:hypothetical protein